jgi:hypothetical protein
MTVKDTAKSAAGKMKAVKPLQGRAAAKTVTKAASKAAPKTAKTAAAKAKAVKAAPSKPAAPKAAAAKKPASKKPAKPGTAGKPSGQGRDKAPAKKK